VAGGWWQVGGSSRSTVAVTVSAARTNHVQRFGGSVVGMLENGRIFLFNKEYISENSGDYMLFIRNFFLSTAEVVFSFPL